MTQPQPQSATGAAGVVTAGLAVAGATNLVAQAFALQQIIADLTTLTAQQLVALFTQLDSGSPEFPDMLRQVYPRIVRQNAAAAATITARWYDELDPASDYRAAPVVDLRDEQLDKTVNWALYAPGESAPLDRLAGSSQRMVANAARDTVTENADLEGVRYARVALPDACAFCRLLATRGPVYRSEQSATRVVGQARTPSRAQRRLPPSLRQPPQYTGRTRGSRKIGEKYHDWCRCEPVPVRGESVYTPPEYMAAWEGDYTAAVKELPTGATDVKAILAHMRANTDAR